MLEDDNWSNEQKGARHLEETNGMTFSYCNHSCHWRYNDMTMISGPSSYTKRRISKYVLCFPYLPSKGLCIRWSLHVVLIFYLSFGSLVCLSFSSSPWGSSCMSSFFMATERCNCTISAGSDCCGRRPWEDASAQFQGAMIVVGWGPGRKNLHSFRMKGRLVAKMPEG